MISQGGRIIDIVTGNWTLDLTVYEVGNAVWKLNTIKSKITSAEADNLLRNLLDIVADRIRLISSSEIDHLSTIRIAREEKLSYYDATYLSIAMTRNLLLVTDDRRLYNSAKKYVKVLTSSHF
ncbi:MAG: type II toxin-antitoxin system VapC family toxin [Thermoplasmata archaeon]|nr:type II toxin-antitoxin system VapC family toxin [Candidatus Sysuiplasma acidicola]